MTTIGEIQAELVDEFAMFDDWMTRYEHVIDLGKQLPDFKEEWKTDENKIHGCQSQVWLHMEMRDGILHIDGISDAAIVSGLVAIVLRVYSDQKPQDILDENQILLPISASRTTLVRLVAMDFIRCWEPYISVQVRFYKFYNP